MIWFLFLLVFTSFEFELIYFFRTKTTSVCRINNLALSAKLVGGKVMSRFMISI